MDNRNRRIKEFFLWIFGFRYLYKVTGNSMSPLLKDGDKVFVKKTKDIHKGDITVANHPYKKVQIIKKVSKVEGDKITLKGANKSESSDSRSFGKIRKKDVIGVVTSKI